MKNKKKILITNILIIFSVGVFLLVSPIDNNKSKTLAKVERKKKQIELMRHTEIKRFPASLKKGQQVKASETFVSKKRIYIGDPKLDKNLTFSNSISNDWEDKYKNRFLKMANVTEIPDFKIQKKRSIIKVKKNTGLYLEHVIISFTKPGGNFFSFEAMIDSQTGIPVQTWNQTRYEFGVPTKLDMSSASSLPPIKN